MKGFGGSAIPTGVSRSRCWRWWPCRCRLAAQSGRLRGAPGVNSREFGAMFGAIIFDDDLPCFAIVLIA